MGIIGATCFTAKDIITSISNKQYVGACIDLVAGAAGIGAGIGLEALGIAIVATFAAPELLVGAVVFGIGVGVGVGIGLDYGEDVIKNEYYRRRH